MTDKTCICSINVFGGQNALGTHIAYGRFSLRLLVSEIKDILKRVQKGPKLKKAELLILYACTVKRRPHTGEIHPCIRGGLQTANHLQNIFCHFCGCLFRRNIRSGIRFGGSIDLSSAALLGRSPDGLDVVLAGEVRGFRAYWGWSYRGGVLVCQAVFGAYIAYGRLSLRHLVFEHQDILERIQKRPELGETKLLVLYACITQGRSYPGEIHPVCRILLQAADNLKNYFGRLGSFLIVHAVISFFMTLYVCAAANRWQWGALPEAISIFYHGA